MVVKPNQCPRWAIEPRGRDGRQQIVRVVIKSYYPIECVGYGLNPRSRVADVSDRYVISVGIQDLRGIHGSWARRSIRYDCAIGKLGFSIDYSSADAGEIRVVDERTIGGVTNEMAHRTISRYGSCIPVASSIRINQHPPVVDTHAE